jgi:hypothetical protein
MKKWLPLLTLPLFAKGFYLGSSAGPDFTSGESGLAAAVNLGYR